MSKIIKFFMSILGLSFLKKFLVKRSKALSYYKDKIKMINKWCLLDKETSNFYYKLTNLNRNYLAHVISVVTGEKHEKIISYFKELEENEELKTHIKNSIIKSGYGKDIQVDYGRRIGWYAIIRICKPKVIVETGVHHGVGACVIINALIKNHEENFTGAYYGTDIDINSGKLISGKYNDFGKVIYGDSINSLKNFEKKIDIFINDSDHNEEYEYNEYITILNKLSSKAIILGDNCHVTEKLSVFSLKNKRNFIFFEEKPESHWYPGAGIGFSY